MCKGLPCEEEGAADAVLQQVNDELQIRTTVVAEEQEALLIIIHIFKQNNIHRYHHSEKALRRKLRPGKSIHKRNQHQYVLLYLSAWY